MTPFEFDGDFDLLPFAAELRYAAVPAFPSSNDFQLAASDVAHDQSAAAVWRLEAIRERRLNPGRKLDGPAMRDINTRVSRRLFEEMAARR